MNFRIYSVIFFLFFSFSSNAQKIAITPNLRVTYQSVLKLGKNNTQKENFVLIGNSKDYYFGAEQNFLNDTKQYKSSGGIDLQMISAEFQERIIKNDNNFDILFSVEDGKIRYKETPNIKWVLCPDTKIINGLKCQMAATNKYGRRWIAYFSKNYDQKIGPYKFSGLPGLILELYDTKDEYHFTASKIEKYNKVFEFNISGFKNYPKKDYLKAKDNLEFGGNKYPGLDAEMKRETDAMLAKLKAMGNNPIELKPFE